MHGNNKRFSVVIPSRNRPELLHHAIQSALAQSHPDFEVIVVDDGSTDEQATAYGVIAKEAPENVRFVHLEPSPRGHGPSYAINRGVESAKGEYVCFLDDDDCWMDPEHLSRAHESLAADDGDLYFSNQHAYSEGKVVATDLWLNPLAQYLDKSARKNQDGAHELKVEDLMTACDGRFAHLNNTIVRRGLYLDVGGMDEYIRYECEWDLYLRLISAANTILYEPTVVARHNVPIAALGVNVSTGMPTLQKFLFRMVVLDKAVMFSSDRLIWRMASKHKIYTLKRISEHLVHEGKFDQALFYARQGKSGPWDMKWRVYTALIAAKASWA